MSIVLVITGIILSMGVSMMKSITRTTAIREARNTLHTVRNSLVTFAVSRGRLPCPDTDSDGVENCPVSGCSNPPCGLPYTDLNCSSTDAWAQPFSYDVTDILTTTTPENMCVVLMELINFYAWNGSPANSPCGSYSMVCATNTSDTDNGAIDSVGTGYYLAAYVTSKGQDTRLGGKNTRDNRREYELSSNPYDTTAGRDDLSTELTLNGLFSQACTPENTVIKVSGQDSDGDGIAAYYSLNNGPCTPLYPSQPISVSLGQNVTFCPDVESSCSGTAPRLSVQFYNGVHAASCAAGSDLMDCDTSGMNWNGSVKIDGNADSSQPVLSDN